MDQAAFTELLWQKARELYRPMPWRTDTRPYYVLVSELMLQQTQVSRVIPKFEAFIAAFPNERTLADAHLSEVLQLWQGLGYNRRAKYLHDAAKKIMVDYMGKFPDTSQTLQSLPGVGKNTAGALLAYAFNEPSVFIETNIRTVYIHHFFSDVWDVEDRAIAELVEQTIDRDHPREFYWALMDYGSYLKSHGVRNIAQGKQYKKQSTLEGSVRQVRGNIIKHLAQSSCSEKELRHHIQADERFEIALQGLIRDGLVTSDATYLELTK